MNNHYIQWRYIEVPLYSHGEAFAIGNSTCHFESLLNTPSPLLLCKNAIRLGTMQLNCAANNQLCQLLMLYFGRLMIPMKKKSSTANLDGTMKVAKTQILSKLFKRFGCQLILFQSVWPGCEKGEFLRRRGVYWENIVSCWLKKNMFWSPALNIQIGKAMKPDRS